MWKALLGISKRYYVHPYWTEIAQQLALLVEQAIRSSQLGFDVYAITPKAA